MPTGARLFCAVSLAVLAFIVSGQVIPQIPERTDFGNMTPINIVVGLAVGWFIMGPRTGRGYVAGITNGLTGMLSMVILSLSIFGAEEMFSRAMDRRYDGPFEAILAIFELALRYSGVLMVTNILLTLFIGGIVAGLVGEMAAKRFR
ncbi:MAG: TrgA family protein [Paracoccaceae bacterium]